MIILQFLKYQLTPAKFCGFLFMSFKKRLKSKLLSKTITRKKYAKAKKLCALKSKKAV